jgi:hypothetical protein
MTVNDFNAAQTACNNIPALAAQQQQAVLQQQLANAASSVVTALPNVKFVVPLPPSTHPTTSAPINTPTPASTDTMIGSFDLTTFLSSYGLYLAIAAGGLFLLSQSKSKG